MSDIKDLKELIGELPANDTSDVIEKLTNYAHSLERRIAILERALTADKRTLDERLLPSVESADVLPVVVIEPAASYVVYSGTAYGPIWDFKAAEAYRNRYFPNGLVRDGSSREVKAAKHIIPTTNDEMQRTVESAAPAVPAPIPATDPTAPEYPPNWTGYTLSVDQPQPATVPAPDSAAAKRVKLSKAQKEVANWLNVGWTITAPLYDGMTQWHKPGTPAVHGNAGYACPYPTLKALEKKGVVVWRTGQWMLAQR